MSELKMAQQLGAVRIVSSRDQAYHGLTRDLKRRVKRGDQILLSNSGEVVVIDRKSLGRRHEREVEIPEVALVTAGTFPWIGEDAQVPVSRIAIGNRSIRLIDISGSEPTLAGLTRRLNGSTPRVDSLIVNSIERGLSDNGLIPGAITFRERQPENGKRGERQPIFGKQSTDPNESTRVAGLFTQPDSSNDAYVVGRLRYADMGKALRVLAGYRYLATTQGARI